MRARPGWRPLSSKSFSRRLRTDASCCDISPPEFLGRLSAPCPLLPIGRPAHLCAVGPRRRALECLGAAPSPRCPRRLRDGRARRRCCSREAHQTGACNQACEGARGAARPGEPVRRRSLRSRLRPDNFPPPHALAGPASNAKLAVATPRWTSSGRTSGSTRWSSARDNWPVDLERRPRPQGIRRSDAPARRSSGPRGPDQAYGIGRSRAGSRPTSPTSTRGELGPRGGRTTTSTSRRRSPP